ncbi:hypothetical protein V6N13_040711 [Hibiscus sabdariffa]
MGSSLCFLSAKASVDSGAHSATNSLHRIDWPADNKPCSSTKIINVIPVVTCAEDGQFPGLYCSSFLSQPWLSDGCTMILSSYWHSCQVILSSNVLRCLHLKLQIMSLLSRLHFGILQVPVKDVSDCLTKGAAKSFEAIFVSYNVNDAPDPLIVFLHGGPHIVSLSSFSKGSLGFGEEALQSLPGKIGSQVLILDIHLVIISGVIITDRRSFTHEQDVNDVLTAIYHVTEKGLVNPSKITVLGGSHGGFLTTHLIGQTPVKFVAAAVRNPACNLSSMVGVTDIPDWCYVESYGTNGKTIFTEAPSAKHLTDFYNKSPILHISKVKAPTLFLLGAQDLRVPVSNGLQYARALKEQGVETRVILFPNDIHAIER